MPVYEYFCQECQEAFDTLRRMNEMDDPINCPRCGSTHTKRQLSVFGVGNSRQGESCKATGQPKPPSCGGG